MTLTLPQRTLLFKFFCRRINNASATLRAFRQVKVLRQGFLIIINLQRMLSRFEEAGTFAVKPGPGRKHIGMQRAEEIATAVVEWATANVHDSSSASAISPDLHILNLQCWEYMFEMLSKISVETVLGDKETRKLCPLMILPRTAVGTSWPCHILKLFNYPRRSSRHFTCSKASARGKAFRKTKSYAGSSIRLARPEHVYQWYFKLSFLKRQNFTACFNYELYRAVESVVHHVRFLEYCDHDLTCDSNTVI